MRACYTVIIFPSLMSKLCVLQYGQVSGISSVSGSMEIILWFFVVAHAPPHVGQFRMMVSISGHNNSTICFISYFLPNRSHQSLLKNPVGGVSGDFSTVIFGSRLGMKTYSPLLRRSAEVETRRTSNPCIDLTLANRQISASGQLALDPMDFRQIQSLIHKPLQHINHRVI